MELIQWLLIFISGALVFIVAGIQEILKELRKP
jgi:hypothetical protein